MSSSCIPSLLLQSLYVVGLGSKSGLSAREVLSCCSRGLSGQGDLDVERLAVSQGKEVEGREGVDRGFLSDCCSGFVVELRGGGNRSAAGVGSGCSVHTDLEVLGVGRGNWDGVFDFDIDIDGGRGTSGGGH